MAGLFQKLQLLACQLFWSSHEACDVASRTSVTLDEPGTNRISGRCHHDNRDRLRGVSGGVQRGWPSGCKDDIDFQENQFCRESWETLFTSFGNTAF